MTSGSANRKRTKQCLVRFTDEEFAQVTDKADSAGLASAAFLRAAALGHPGLRARRRPPADHRALRRILGELARVGNNINQIAYHLNCGDPVHIPELREALTGYQDIREAILEAFDMSPVSGMPSGMNPELGAPPGIHR